MDIEKISVKKIQITDNVNANITQTFEFVSNPHQMSLWLASQVSKTSKGFTAIINLPLHTIRLEATILKVNNPDLFEFMWYSEYVMDKTMVTIKLKEISPNETKIKITEVGPFNKSQWSKSQDIHIDLWKEALKRLNNKLSLV